MQPDLANAAQPDFATAAQLERIALCNTAHPGDAATLLIVAAATILERRWGPSAALDILSSTFEVAANECRKASAA